MWLSADLWEIFNMNNVILTLHMIYTTYDICTPPLAITQVVIQKKNSKVGRSANGSKYAKNMVTTLLL